MQIKALQPFVLSRLLRWHFVTPEFIAPNGCTVVDVGCCQCSSPWGKRPTHSLTACSSKPCSNSNKCGCALRCGGKGNKPKSASLHLTKYLLHIVYKSVAETVVNQRQLLMQDMEYFPMSCLFHVLDSEHVLISS